MAKYKFPKGFLWGAAISANQSEGAFEDGGKGLSNIDVIPFGENRIGIKLGVNPPTYPDDHYYPSHTGVDFYHKYKEDIKLMSDLGLKVFRTSIAWSRLYPLGDEEKPNKEGILFYKSVFQECAKYGIQPLVTLSHFDVPYGLVEKYGDDKNYYPPVNTLFWSFRIMAGFGALMLLVAALGLFFTRKKKPSLYEKKWMLWIVALCTFAPFLANTTGWLVTELGRYPWTVYGLFTIEQSVSPNVSVASLITSNVIYFLLFAGLGSVMVYLVILELRKGPDYEAKKLAKENEPALDPFDKGVFGE
ncbi:MAG: family 1 glycosylhydrolase [Enterococcus sp.]|nr:family 1 glycosylhydrolase [Enterococcus sp.]